MNQSELLEVLESYAAATPNGNDKEILEKWLRNYPRFSKELIDFAANRDLRTFPVQEDVDEALEFRFLASSRDSFERLRARQSQLSIESLTALAERRYLGRRDFAAKLGISLSLLMYLEKRRLEFMTIPKRLIKQIAELLEVSQEAVAKFLDQRPDFATGANYKAKLRPSEAKPKSFIEAVLQDQEMTPEQKNWLIRMAQE